MEGSSISGNDPPRARAGRAALPSVDRLLRDPACAPLTDAVGRALAAEALRQVVDEARAALAEDPGEAPDPAALIDQARARAEALMAPSLRPVFNLTGTVIHTNLGRAPLPEEAVAAIAAVAARPVNLEYDLDAGRRGDRDVHLEDWVCRLTGAEAATVVNNNAAAVLLVLNSLAQRKEAIVYSRGELIEIGGSFRLPDIMKRAGAKLVEVGTTNRTHAKDYRQAVGPRTALILRAHTSNFEVQGFTAAVPDPTLADLAREAGLPYVVDLGSGTLVDLDRFGLPHEPTVRETLGQGADLVTFSGDKLLGGPQAGVIAGRADLIGKIKANPMRRALRVDKLTIAALEAVLRLYADPDRLAGRIPALRLLTRAGAEIATLAERLKGPLAEALDGVATVSVEPCRSQIGSGAMPVEAVDSTAVVLHPVGPRKRAGAAAKRLADAFRALPVPVIGRVAEGALHFDLRCLEDEAGFVAQLPALAVRASGAQ